VKTAEPRAALDASALVAVLWEEPGAGTVEPLLAGAAISSVNWAEVLQRYRAVEVATTGKRESIEGLGVRIEAFTSDDADVVDALWAPTRRVGLSLADRACLALAIRLKAPAYTADRAWGDVDVDVDASVVLIR
jgi:PIN domain nuclease of toxin-antitoxin system